MSQGVNTECGVPIISFLLIPELVGETYQINNLATAPPQTRPPNPSFHPSLAIRCGRTKPEKRAIGT